MNNNRFSETENQVKCILPQSNIDFPYSIHPKSHDKKDPQKLAKGWTIHQGSILDLLRSISRGRAFCCGIFEGDHRAKNNFVKAQTVCLDIDEGLSLDECLGHSFIQEYAAAIYTSPSHQQQKGKTPPCDRYRIIFVLPTAIKEVGLYEAVVKSLFELFPMADRSCSDASRLWFGNSRAQIVFKDATKVLPKEVIEGAKSLLSRPKPEFKGTVNPEIATGDLQSLALDALQAIKASEAGSGSYEKIYRRLVWGLKGCGFDEDQITDILTEHSGRKNAGQITRSLKVENIASLFKVARAQGWTTPQWHVDKVCEEFEPLVKAAFECENTEEILNQLFKKFTQERFIHSQHWRSLIQKCRPRSGLISSLKYQKSEVPITYTEKSITEILGGLV